ncbi:MAG: GIY-YIG nuclease family protein [Cyclobacteriaceae bacterium]
MSNYNYFVYITTNPGKTALYVGMTNDLRTRIRQHKANKGNPKSHAGKYFCYNLIYFERFGFVDHAIGREKEIKGWRRQKKEDLIATMNPRWDFYDAEVLTRD